MSPIMRIDALQHDQLAGLGGQDGRGACRGLPHRIVAEAHDLGIAEPAAVIDRRMAVGVEDDVIPLPASVEIIPRLA